MFFNSFIHVQFILAISTSSPPLTPFPLVETPVLLRSLSPTLMYFWVCDTELLMWEWVGNHLLGMCYCSAGTPLMRLTWQHPSLGWSIASIIVMLRLSPLFYQSLLCLFCDSCQSFMLRIWLLFLARHSSAWEAQCAQKAAVVWISLGLPNVSYENYYLQTLFGTQDFWISNSQGCADKTPRFSRGPLK